MIKSITTETQDIVDGWWEKRGYAIFARGVLPAGFIAYYEEKPIMAVYLYHDLKARDLCYLQWLISDPDSTKEERAKTFDELFSFIEEESRKLGIKVISIFAHNPVFKERLKTIGYLEDTKPMTACMKQIN